MKRGEIEIRGAAAALTVGFLMIVKTDPNPSLMGVGITALLMYEGLTFCLSYIEKVRRKKKEDRYITVSRQDIRRWADTQLYWPIEEAK